MQEIKNSPSQTRDYKLDILKAISIIFVLFLHLDPIELESSSNVVAKILQNFIIIFREQIASVSVATFILVSLYLFCMKISNSFAYLKRRSLNLFRIYIFWTFIQLFIYLMMVFYRSSTHNNIEIPNFSISQVILEGGPPLPIVAGSVFYFLFVLQVLTIISFLYNTISEKFRQPLGVIIIIIFLVYFEGLNYSNNSLIYWRVDNYIIYVPMSFYLFKNLQRNLNLRYFYLAGFIGFSIHDIYMRKIGHNFSGNGRISIFLGVIALFCFIYSQEFQERKYLNFLSKYSLGIFAIHRYWQLLWILVLTNLFSLFNLPEFLNVFDIKLKILPLAVALLTLVFVVFSIKILKLTSLKRFIA